MPPSPAIKVLDLHRSFGENKAVQGASFDVQQGEIFSLLHLNNTWRKFPEGRLL
jgi:ABC-type uncharacterized transport system ATPase subunit